MIEIIDLSNFREKVFFYSLILIVFFEMHVEQKFSKAGLKELLESIVDMRCLSALS